MKVSHHLNCSELLLLGFVGDDDFVSLPETVDFLEEELQGQSIGILVSGTFVSFGELLLVDRGVSDPKVKMLE